MSAHRLHVIMKIIGDTSPGEIKSRNYVVLLTHRSAYDLILVKFLYSFLYVFKNIF